MPNLSPPSQIRLLAVDPPLIQDAQYRFNAVDRAYLDDQIRGCQLLLVSGVGTSQAIYNAVLPTLGNGAQAPIELDQNGRVLINASPPATTWVDCGAAVSERQLVNAPCTLWQLYGVNAGASTRYVFIFDAVARPGAAATTEAFVPIPVDPGKPFSLDLDVGRAFAVGLYVGISSTAASFTYDAAATFLLACEKI